MKNLKSNRRTTIYLLHKNNNCPKHFQLAGSRREGKKHQHYTLYILPHHIQELINSQASSSPITEDREKVCHIMDDSLFCMLELIKNDIWPFCPRWVSVICEYGSSGLNGAHKALLVKQKIVISQYHSLEIILMCN